MIFRLIRSIPGRGTGRGLIYLVVIGVLITACQSFKQPDAQVKFIENPSEEAGRFPRLSLLPDDAVLMSWTETLSGIHILKFAVYKQGRWTQRGEVAQGTNWFVNWADFPAVTPIDQSFWVAHWQVQSSGGRSHEHDILLSISTDAGTTWSKPEMPYRPTAAADRGFVTVFPVGSEAGVVWLDGSDPESDNTSLRYTLVNRNGQMDKVQTIDRSTCTCCWIAAAVTDNYPVIAWRSRRENEIRDHHIARLNQDKWLPPLPLSQERWSIAGCPVNGPALAASSNRIVASWFTAENQHPRVRAAFSSDDPLQFHGAFDVDDANPAGRIQIEWLNDHTAFVTWITAINNVTKKASLAGRKLFTDGTMGPIIRLVDISPGRQSGIPQLVRNETGFMLAWTNTASPYRVQTVQIPLEILNQ